MKTPKFARWGRGIAGALSLTLLFSLSAAALEPYRNYTYDSEENAWVEPQAYYAADILRAAPWERRISISRRMFSSRRTGGSISLTPATIGSCA